MKIFDLLAVVFHAYLTDAWQYTSPADVWNTIHGQEKILIAYLFEPQTQSSALKPVWASVDETAQGVRVMSVNCSTYTSFCIEMDAVAYPAIRFHHGDGQITRYRGPRKLDSILAFLKRVSRPMVTEISDTALTDFVSSDDVTFTAEFSQDEAVLYEWQYRDLAKQYHDRLSFALLPTSKQQSVVRCRNNVNDQDFTLKELWLAGALEELLSQCTAPLILEPTRREISELGQLAMRVGKYMAVHYFAASESDKDTYRKEMQTVANKYSSQYLFTIIDSNEHPQMSTAIGSGFGGGVLVENLSTGEMFLYTEEQTSATKMEAFLLGIIKGVVTPWDGAPQGSRHDEL